MFFVLDEHVQSPSLTVANDILGHLHYRMSRVSLQDRNIARVDAAALQLPPDAHTLDLSRNRIVKIDMLDSLVNLQVLNLSFNRLVKVEGLSRLPQLHVVNVSNNSIRDLGGLAHCLSLQELCAIVNITSRLQQVTPCAGTRA
jgi:Leucine-rich repeat (LRR) protein